MSVDIGRIEETLDRLAQTEDFSGVVSIDLPGVMRVERAYGFANRSEAIPNSIQTRFQVASGCKIFTAVAISQLVQRGLFGFQSLLTDCLSIEFPNFARNVTVHQLLTHTSGIPDYFEEVEGADYEALWLTRPNYRMQGPTDFLPLFRGGEMQHEPGSRFVYNNAGFIVLGLIVEQHGKRSFTEFVREEILQPCGMTSSGYYRFDQLPDRTASAYIKDGEDHSWRTNIYSVPVVGGPDGGAYVTASDMVRFWRALSGSQLLDRETTETLLHRHVPATEGQFATHYGYGVWIREGTPGAPIHFIEGWDPGVAFLSIFDRKRDLVITIARNTQGSVWKLLRAIESLLG